MVKTIAKTACNNLQRLSKSTLLAILPSYFDQTFVIDVATGNKIRIDSLNSGPIAKIQVLSSGDGYTSTPDVIISGGNGNGASAIAIIVDGKLNRIDITDIGNGYTKPPSVTIFGGGGSGAYAISYLKDLTNVLKNGIIRGKYQRIETSYPRNLLVNNDNWSIKSFNPNTREVCISFQKPTYVSNNTGVCPRQGPDDTRPLNCPHGSSDVTISYTIPIL